MPRSPLPLGAHGNISARKTNSGWEVSTRYRTPQGNTQQVRLTRPTKNAALSALQERIEHLSTVGGLRGAGVNAHSTINGLLDEWLALRALDRLNESTVARNIHEAKAYIRPALGSLRLYEVTTPVLNHFIVSLAAKTHGTAVQVRITLKLAFDYAVLMGAIPHNPVIFTRKIKQNVNKVVAYKPQELRDMRGILESWVHSSPRVGRPRDPTSLYVFDVILGTGIRIGESLGLLQSEYRKQGALGAGSGEPLPSSEVSVSGTVKSLPGRGVLRQPFTKTENSMRVVPLPRFAAESLEKAMRLHWAQGHELVFPSLRGGVRADSGIRTSWKKAFAGTPFEGVRPHDLRRAVATAVRNEHGLDAAAAQIGHASSATTSKYYVEKIVHRSPEVLGGILGLE